MSGGECSDKIVLDVRGTCVPVLRSTLRAGSPSSLLRRMFPLPAHASSQGPSGAAQDTDDDARWALKPQADGSYFIDDDPSDFAVVLQYLRCGAARIKFATDRAADAWRVAGLASYYMLHDLEQACIHEALSAELAATPAPLVATVQYVFEDDLGEDDARVGLGFNRSQLIAMRTWPTVYACARIGEALGVPMEQLVFYDTELSTSGTAIADLYVRRAIDPWSETPIERQAWWRRSQDGILFVRRLRARPDRHLVERAWQPLLLPPVPARTAAERSLLVAVPALPADRTNDARADDEGRKPKTSDTMAIAIPCSGRGGVDDGDAGNGSEQGAKEQRSREWPHQSDAERKMPHVFCKVYAIGDDDAVMLDPQYRPTFVPIPTDPCTPKRALGALCEAMHIDRHAVVAFCAEYPCGQEMGLINILDDTSPPSNTHGGATNQENDEEESDPEEDDESDDARPQRCLVDAGDLLWIVVYAREQRDLLPQGLARFRQAMTKGIARHASQEATAAFRAHTPNATVFDTLTTFYTEVHQEMVQ